MSNPSVSKLGKRLVQGSSTLHEDGGNLVQSAQSYEISGLLSCASAHTQLYGAAEKGPASGWTTEAVSIIEGLDIRGIITVDRMVSHLSAFHPTSGYVPRITFLQTTIVNLRIAGTLIKTQLDLDILGENLSDKSSHITDESLMLSFRSLRRNTTSTQDETEVGANTSQSDLESPHHLTCSLASRLHASGNIRTDGNRIDVPGLGKLHVATLTIDHSDFNNAVPKTTKVGLTMLSLRMSDDDGGGVDLGNTIVNGMSQP